MRYCSQIMGSITARWKPGSGRGVSWSGMYVPFLTSSHCFSAEPVQYEPETEEKTKKKKLKSSIETLHCDLIKKEFWDERPHLLED